MHAHTVGIDAAPAPTTPDVAIGVATNAVREAGLKVCKHLPTAHGRPVFYNIEDDNICRIIGSIRCTGIDDVELAVIGREADPVWSTHRSFGNYRGLSGLAIDAINAGRQFEFSFVTFVGPEDAIAWIGKPDRAVPVNCGIVGRI